jgi:hypothetical protein
MDEDPGTFHRSKRSRGRDAFFSGSFEELNARIDAETPGAPSREAHVSDALFSGSFEECSARIERNAAARAADASAEFDTLMEMVLAGEMTAPALRRSCSYIHVCVAAGLQKACQQHKTEPGIGYS